MGILILSLFNSTFAAPVKNQVEVVAYSFRHLANNGYHFMYELSDGQSRDELGIFENVDGKLLLQVTGTYTYVGDDSKIYTVSYTADKNGKY